MVWRETWWFWRAGREEARAARVRVGGAGDREASARRPHQAGNERFFLEACFSAGRRRKRPIPPLSLFSLFQRSVFLTWSCKLPT
jgi:hypothetical protein